MNVIWVNEPNVIDSSSSAFERGSFGGGGLPTKYAATCAVAASAFLGRSIPAESTVMKEWVRFLVIPSTCASERRGVLGLYLELWLRDPELLIADSSARLWLEASAASLRLMSSVCSLAKMALFFSSIEW